VTAGATELPVQDATGFEVGDVISIGEGGTAELNRITGIAPNAPAITQVSGPATLTLECPLVYDHAAGEPVSVSTQPFVCEPEATPTVGVTQTPQVTRTVQATRTAQVTRTVEPTDTPEPEPECWTLKKKFRVLLQILRRLDTEEGDRRYKAKYDLDGDGDIDWDDVEFLFEEIPTCRPRHWHRWEW
jgi:hypothetical protein